MSREYFSHVAGYLCRFRNSLSLHHDLHSRSFAWHNLCLGATPLRRHDNAIEEAASDKTSELVDNNQDTMLAELTN